MGGSSSLRQVQGRRNILGERMGLARRLATPHLTFAELSRLIAERTEYTITLNALIKIEMGIRPAYDYEVAAVAKALNISPAFLLGLADAPDPISTPTSVT